MFMLQFEVCLPKMRSETGKKRMKLEVGTGMVRGVWTLPS